MREVFLCQKHAEMYGFFTPHAYQLRPDLPMRTLGTILSSQACPQCGCSKEWIVQQKRVGCPHCYKAFPEIKPHGFKQRPLHFGKFPKNITNAIALQPRLDFLTRQLQALVNSERFEAAQEVRQEINLISRKIKNASTHIQ